MPYIIYTWKNVLPDQNRKWLCQNLFMEIIEWKSGKIWILMCTYYPLVNFIFLDFLAECSPGPDTSPCFWLCFEGCSARTIVWHPEGEAVYEVDHQTGSSDKLLRAGRNHVSGKYTTVDNLHSICLPLWVKIKIKMKNILICI